MPDESPKKKNLSEISHLFLSSLRDNATGGRRPQRIGPNQSRPQASVDLTPEEFAQVLSTAPTDSARSPIGPASAIIASHLNGKQFDRVKQYARHLAATGQRVGLIEVDASEFRVMVFDRGPADSSVEATESYDIRQMALALDELACDVDRWLLLLPNPRTPEARTLLRSIDHWTLLSTCDHDGVVSCYRAIKGLADAQRPRLSLALLSPIDQTEAGRVHRKIANVCQQFLNWPLEAEAAVEPVDNVAEHLVILCRPSRDKASVAGAAQFHVVTDFLTRNHRVQPTEPTVTREFPPTAPAVAPAEPRFVADVVVPAAPAQPAEPKISQPAPAIALTPAAQPSCASTQSPGCTSGASDGSWSQDDSEITDLPAGLPTESAVLAAVIKNTALGLVECPVHPPMCPAAVLAVGRDHRLVILAVAHTGLSDLRAIGQAYRWVIENRPLLSMALPQFSIDAHSMPALRVLVDRADASADVLQPMLQSGNVTVQTYRKLRWGEKTGLLLEAA